MRQRVGEPVVRRVLRRAGGGGSCLRRFLHEGCRDPIGGAGCSAGPGTGAAAAALWLWGEAQINPSQPLY